MTAPIEYVVRHCGQEVGRTRSAAKAARMLEKVVKDCPVCSGRAIATPESIARACNRSSGKKKRKGIFQAFGKRRR